MATQQEVIKRFMAYLDTTTVKGSAAIDQAINYATSGSSRHFSTAKEAIAAMKADISSTNNADTFLKEFCGINLDNTDTGAITGSDAGGSTTKTATSIVPESGSLKNFTGNSFSLSKYGITFYLSEIDNNGYVNMNSTLSFYDLTPKQQYIWQGLYTWWANNALDLITESYGSNFGFSSGTLIYPQRIYFGFGNENDGSNAASGPLAYLDNSTKKETAALVFRVNMNAFNSIDTSDPSGVNGSGEYLDRTIAHELTHCVMAANINYYISLPQFIREGMAELTIGGDDGELNQAYMKSLAIKSAVTATGTNKSFLDNALDLSNTSTGDAKAYAGGYMFLRYLAKQAADSGTIVDGVINNTTNNTSITTTDANKIIKNSGKYVTITSGAGNDFVENSGYNVTVNSGAGKDTITSQYTNYLSVMSGIGDDLVSLFSVWYGTIDGGAGNDTIVSPTNARNNLFNGGDGNDLISLKSSYSGSSSTIFGGKGNDTIYSDTGAHLFNYNLNDGDDLIKGFNANSTLQIGSGTGTYSSQKSGSGSDIIVTVGTGKITLSGAASLSAVNIKGSLVSGNIFTEGNDNYNNSVSGVTLNALGGNDSINNTASNVVIYGNSGNDSVRNAYGNNVTINTGAGKDSVIAWGSNIKINDDSGDNYVKLYADAKNVTVLTGDGKDSIYTGGQTVSVNAGSDNDYIHIYKQAVKTTVTGGVGDDTIKNYSKNGVLYVYKPGDGNDSIWGFNETSTLRFGSSTNVSLQKKNNDVIATVGKDKITLSGAASLSAINIQGSAKNDSIRSTVSGAKIDARGGNDKIYNYASGKVTISGGSGDDTITNWGGAASMDGGKGNDLIWGDSGKDTLTGGSGNDKLHGEEGNDKLYGGSGNDSLWGGTGNDSLWGGSGKDVFIYKPGEGKDRIFDYESGDMLKILEDDGSKGSFKKSKYSGGDLTLTISGGGTVIFDGVSKSDKFNINGTTYKISGSKLVKK